MRLHPAAIAVSAVDALRESVLPLAVIGGVTVLGGGVDAGSVVRLAIYAVLATVLAATVGYVRWATTTYWLDDDAVHLRRGLLNRQHAAVPIDRVSSLDSVQGPVHRLLGVTELQVHAAGGGREPEVVLKALSGPAVSVVRHAVGRRAEEPPAEGLARRPPVRRLSRGALLVAALTSGQFTVLLPVLAALSQSFDEALGPEGGEPAVERYVVPDTASEALVAIAALLLLAWLIAFAGTVIAFAGFTVEREEDRLRVSRGFLQRRVSTIPIARVQAIRVVEGVLRQPFGLASARVESAGYANERSVNTTLFPLLPRRELDGFLRAAVPELAASLEPLTPPPPRSRWLYVGAPFAIGTLVALPLAVLFSPFLLLLAPAAAAVGLLRMRAAGWRLADDLLISRSRRLARTTIVAASRRLPERSFTQGPLERRLGLATLDFALASRTRWEVRHIEAPRVGRLVAELRPRQHAAAGGA